MTSPLIGPPSIISYLPIESVSVYVEGPLPVCSRRIISTSIYLILTRTSMNEIFPKYKHLSKDIHSLWIIGLEFRSFFIEAHRNPTYNCFIQMISCFIVFEFNVKWIFDSDLNIKLFHGIYFNLDVAMIFGIREIRLVWSFHKAIKLLFTQIWLDVSVFGIAWDWPWERPFLTSLSSYLHF